ncbi:T9SS type A sorting domain-containing protein [Pseudobacter ginsenosidimutans]|uniref:Putative secreted protein (Por secretion system target) n=1 Tax=Pseudobacter ginsenosidimutans TaxID=661488 RepID=A0A4Q7MKW1_9BACT|nr:T9SS type A sorting domain-containing protein [Pseudobacter ginsenosidimutans]QEC40409.1 T9SS type A sorting domain-containing protein [Pseudobacter ginsenosidimutans]RZS68985.1 putative secreted protein (Por secretion system target) [Pseudobacter ginsenosidimutans]
MKNRYTPLFLSLFLGASITLHAQCPRLAGIMVDACATGNTESRNEFIFCVNGNTNLNVDDLRFTFPTGAAIGAGTTDFAPNTGLAPIGTCLTVLDDGDVIPANAPFIIFMSSNVAVAYDFSSWCTEFGQVYLLYKTNPAPVPPAFLNETSVVGGEQRSVTFNVNGSPACGATYTYDVPVGTGVSVDGNFFRFPEPTAGVSLSPGFVNNGCASPPFELLPVTLEGFTASYRNNNVQLSWSTATELNVSHFEILRSSDGIHYATIGTVAAAGNTSSITRYSYNDNNPSPSRNYYRLKIVDLDGSAEFSKIISIRANASGITLNSLYPNPANEELVIEWNGISNLKTQVSVRNLQGQLLQTQTVTTLAGFNQLKLNTSKLPAGQYFLTLDFGTDNMVQSFLKR